MGSRPSNFDWDAAGAETATIPLPSINAAIAFLEHELNLAQLAVNLRHDPHASVHEADIDLAVREYRRFLILKVVHNDAQALLLSPSPVIDAVWHAHILDTRAYAAMNEHLPSPIHYEPKGDWDADTPNRARRLKNTLTCYRARWGEPPALIWLERRAAREPPEPEEADVSSSPPPYLATSPLPPHRRSRSRSKTRPPTLSLSISDSRGNDIKVTVDPNDTVRQLKVEYHRLGGSAAYETTFALDHVKLNDARTLTECGITNGDVIEASIRPLGAFD
ncbi:hypothetical protein AMAG_00079 [Allomyces macrogynus ATCC 38327]|uniref:Ubiquitin-like domain-containing protein n=1 Tax=Allomyces macrogynus (strain ATCC 38327) TaxID=578462 RepID=A0A0L0RVC1_ALLM3|nr:hypothetical protein AMAG_00079 [Allomyces macrogynus ATCC 38327]|eukprot:KNE54079.1 hypothetical protein AMAG_00079 [Allomyces macrogynus ATCC 38327]